MNDGKGPGAPGYSARRPSNVESSQGAKGTHTKAHAARDNSPLRPKCDARRMDPAPSTCALGGAVTWSRPCLEISYHNV